jgi:hypothetical protein
MIYPQAVWSRICKAGVAVQVTNLEGSGGRGYAKCGVRRRRRGKELTAPVLSVTEAQNGFGFWLLRALASDHSVTNVIVSRLRVQNGWASELTA